MFPITETVRHLILIVGSATLAFSFAFLAAEPFIAWLTKHKIGKNIRTLAIDGKEADLFHKLHSKKAGTPTMGGILIWASTLLVVLFSRVLSYFGIFEHSLLNRRETYLTIATLLFVALLGVIDDLYNIRGWGKSHGLNAQPKMISLLFFAFVAALWFYFKLDFNSIHVPGIGDFALGWLYIPIFIFIIVGSSHAMNFTDGLDGLAGGLSVIAFGTYSALSYAHGMLILSAFCAVIAGASLAFLWFNIAPARFYMGDTGSIALGATLGVIAMLTDTLFILPFIAFIPVLETLSVIIQLFSKKFFGRKVFRIAPLHHHFEQMGWPETQVVMRFWIVGGLMATFGLLLGLVGMGD
ncbi:phospho-N-acetylmuramoyl-pentapeptide-transferase [Candidatus Peregrinibacteria bacterium]|nr:MAG: phospho-N-acetylmuramoyl-pentapeptide-transferase [Candidatus Peregrinibacteria bacterium]